MFGSVQTELINVCSIGLLLALCAWADGSTVSSIRSSFAVDSQGSGVFTIPIPVPPGVQHIQPDISLRISGGSGGLDSSLGSHASLQGFSSISRCPQSLARDGAVVGVDFS